MEPLYVFLIIIFLSVSKVCPLPRISKIVVEMLGVLYDTEILKRSIIDTCIPVYMRITLEQADQGLHDGTDRGMV